MSRRNLQFTDGLIELAYSRVSVLSFFHDEHVGCRRRSSLPRRIKTFHS